MLSTIRKHSFKESRLIRLKAHAMQEIRVDYFPIREAEHRRNMENYLNTQKNKIVFYNNHSVGGNENTKSIFSYLQE